MFSSFFCDLDRILHRHKLKILIKDIIHAPTSAETLTAFFFYI